MYSESLSSLVIIEFPSWILLIKHGHIPIVLGLHRPSHFIWLVIPHLQLQDQCCLILVSHSPPLGIQDSNGKGNVCGSEVLLRHVVERVKPMYHIFGHIHESYGIATNGKTTFANAASCTHGIPRVAENPPFVFDLERV